MSSYAIMTNTGRNKEAAALANGTAMNIAEIAWGDGDYAPSGGELALQNELGRKPVQDKGLPDGALNTAFFEVLLTEAEGPFVIHEAGLFDGDGDLIAIVKYDPPVNKPKDTVSAILRINVVFSDLENLILKIDATTAFVPAIRNVDTGDGLTGGGSLENDLLIDLDMAALSALLLASGFVSNAGLAAIYTAADVLAKLLSVDGPGSGIDADKLDGNEATAFATAAQGLKADAALPAAHVLDEDTFATNSPTKPPSQQSTKVYIAAELASAIADLVASAPGTLDTLNELAAALGDDPNFAASITAQIGTKLNSSAYTAADILAKLLTIDGPGSGIDADLLDGKHASAFQLENEEINLPDSKFLTWKDGLHRIMHNDGNGNVGFRFGSRADANGVYGTFNNTGGIGIIGTIEGVSGVLEIQTFQKVTSVGDVMVPGPKLVMKYDGTFTWGGKNLLTEDDKSGTLIVRDEKTNGTNAQGLTGGVYVTRELNTVEKNTLTGASLAGNQITLPAGDREWDISVPAFQVNIHRAVLYDVTNGVVLDEGTHENSHQNAMATSSSRIIGGKTLATPIVVEVRHICTTTIATGGGDGRIVTNDTEPHVFTVAKFW